MSNLLPYESPSVEVLKLVQEETLLAGSGGIDSLEEDEFGWQS